MNPKIALTIGGLLSLFLAVIMVISIVNAQEEALLYSQEFEEGQAPEWQLDQGWEIVDIDDGHTLAGRGHVWASLQTGSWSDYRLRFKVKLSGDAALHANFRLTEGPTRYFIGLNHEGLYLSKQTGLETFYHELAIAPGIGDGWQEIEINGFGPTITILVNGQKVMTYSDQDPILFGGIAFETLMEEQVLIDDIEIWGAAPSSSEPSGDEIQSKGELAWVRLGGPLGGLGYDIRMRPDNPDIMYVTDANAGVHKSIDGGQSWTSINEGIDLRSGPTGDIIPVFCLTIDPNNYDTLWIGLTGIEGIYRSDDGGNTWQKKISGIEERNGLTIRGITIEPGNSDVVYAAGEVPSWIWAGEARMGRGFDRTMGVVYKSIDGGQSWEAIWRGDNLSRYVWIDPSNTETIYVSTGIFDREAANTNLETNNPGGVGIVKSVDGGKTWDVLDADDGLTGLYVGSLFMHPEHSEILMAGTGHDYWSWPHDQGGIEISHGGVFITEDGGKSWHRTLEGEPIYSVEYCLSNPDIAYAAGTLSVYRSETGGNSWQRVSGGRDSGGYWGPPGVVAGFPIDIQCDPRDYDRLFVNNYGGGNFLSEDGGKSWIDVSKGYSGAMVFGGLAMKPDEPTRIYAGARSGLFRSDDGGETWTGLAYNPARHAEITALGASPVDSNTVISSPWDMYNLAFSKSGGMDWQIIGENSGYIGGNALDIVFSKDEQDIAYLSVGNAGCIYMDFRACGEGGRGIFFSDDGGESWHDANDEQTRGVNAISLAIDPADPTTVYAAAGRNGIYRSRNSGEDWEKLPLECKAWSVAIHPVEPNIIYAGCSGKMYISSDDGETWMPSSAGLPPEGLFKAIVIDPSSPNNVWAADYFSGIYHSLDDGQSWGSHNEGLTVRAVTDLIISQDGQTLFAATHGGGVYRLSTLSQEEFDTLALIEPELVVPIQDTTPQVKPTEAVATPTTEPASKPSTPESDDEAGGGGLPCLSGFAPIALVGVTWGWKHRKEKDVI